MDYTSRNYPNRLKVIRQNSGYTQIAVARLLGQNSAVKLCEWESGRLMPNGRNLMKLCVLYGKSPQELYPDYCRKLFGE